MSEKKTKRSRIKYPALDATVNLKTRQDLISDYDYINKLTPKEKEWLNKFTKEYVNAELNSKQPKKNFHKTKKLKKDCYDRNNARNRCIYTRSKASWNLNYIEDVSETDKNLMDNTIEDQLILKLDSEKDN